MKKQVVNVYFIWMISIYTGLSSCVKLANSLDDSTVAASEALSSKEGIKAAITGLYTAMQDDSYYGTNYWSVGELLGGNITSMTLDNQNFVTHLVNADNTKVRATWNQIYKAINNANYIIEAAPLLNDAAFNKGDAEAEARCLRALFYFDLLRYFGGSPLGYSKPGGVGVPLWLTPTKQLKDATPKPRSTEQEVFAQIRSDLDFAIATLSPSSPDGKVNSIIAKGLKARVLLYQERWDDAEKLAGEAIGGTESMQYGGLSPIYGDLWLKKNQKPESLWELQYSLQNPNSIAKSFYPFVWMGNITGGQQVYTISNSLILAHEAGDVRQRVNAANSIPPINLSIPDNTPLKFTRLQGDDNVMLIRLAELYLIRAEARIKKTNPDIPGAITCINFIRSRAQLPNTTATTPDELMLAVEKERRIEFAFEGHIWFDMRRYNKFSTIGLMKPYQTLLPIPQTEVESSGGVVKQNDGY